MKIQGAGVLRFSSQRLDLMISKVFASLDDPMILLWSYPAFLPSGSLCAEGTGTGQQNNLQEMGYTAAQKGKMVLLRGNH